MIAIFKAKKFGIQYELAFFYFNFDENEGLSQIICIVLIDNL